MRAWRGRKNACEGRKSIFDGLEFFPVPKSHCFGSWSKTNSIEPQRQDRSKSDRIQIILLDSASSAAKNVEVGILVTLSLIFPLSSPPSLPQTFHLVVKLFQQFCMYRNCACQQWNFYLTFTTSIAEQIFASAAATFFSNNKQSNLRSGQSKHQLCLTTSVSDPEPD